MGKIYSITRMAFYRSPYTEEANGRLVVLPYYEGKTFGYYVAWESEETIKESLFWVYLPLQFFKKTSEYTAQEAVDWAHTYIADKINGKRQNQDDSGDGSH